MIHSVGRIDVRLRTDALRVRIDRDKLLAELRRNPLYKTDEESRAAVVKMPFLQFLDPSRKLEWER